MAAIVVPVALLAGFNTGGCPSESDPGDLGNPANPSNPTYQDPTGGTGGSGGNSYSPVYVSNPSAAPGNGSVVAGETVVVPLPNVDGGGNAQPDAEPNEPTPDDDTPADPEPDNDPPGPIDPPLPNQATLVATPALLQFGTFGTELSFQLKRNGTGSLDYVIAPDGNCDIWASASHETGSITDEIDTITVFCDRYWLVDYTIVYGGYVNVAASNGQVLQIRVETQIPAPTLVPIISHTLLDFDTDIYQIAVTISNADGDPIPFSVSSTDPWVELDKVGGTIPGAPSVFTFSVTVRRCDIEWESGEHLSSVVIYPGLQGQSPIVLPVRAYLEPLPDDSAVAAQLAPLPALPKRHMSYATSWRLVEDLSSGLLYQYVRITHALTLEIIQASGEPELVANAILVCKQVNASSPTLPAVLVLKYSPYGYFLPPNAPPWYNGPEVQQELDELTARLTAVKNGWIAGNALHSTNVAVDTIILNTENWNAKLPDEEGAQAWNEASRQKYDAAYNICKAIFPTAKVHWYNRGKPIERGGYFTLEEQGEGCSMEVYYTYDLAALRDRYRKGYEFAQTIGEIPVPWINLNGGMYTLPNGGFGYLCGTDWPEIQSWQLGLELNYPGFTPPPEHNPPLNVAETVAIYPSIFRKSQPYFAKQFIAYVKGAANIPLDP